MSFVELNRDFVRLQADQPYRAEVFEGIRLFSSGGEKWSSLLEHERVVVLAEAASGKSEEFRQRARALRDADAFALYLPIERLEKNGLLGSLGIDDRAAFATWQRGAAPGWFFLDSIDEARIHHKDVESALNRFAADLGETYERARILLSCRGSVWAGEKDLALINMTLPIRNRAGGEDTAPVDSDAILLDRPENATSVSKKELPEPSVRLVALAKITRSQRSAFLTAEKVADINIFEEALFKRGLDRLAERPGDLKTLVRYWKKHETFGDLTEMVEFGIIERLAEANESRRATVGVSDAEARGGAERLAAAMTLGQTMDLILPDLADGDPDGINPHHVLDDWNPRDVDGLLQRGLFVPSSFGRLRFHHRSVQEYLTACWFKRLQPGLSDAELYRIFLSNAYGVDTIPPSLRAAAAWVAQTHEGLREHILDHEPHILLAEGDPRKLSIADRSQLLTTFASRQLAGDSTHHLIDHQALWMFADERLAPAIHKALAINVRADFRFEMLRLIQQGKLKGCRDVVIETALERGAGPYHRIVATDMLALTEDTDGLAAVASDILSDPHPLPANLAPAMTTALFPAALNVDQLLKIIGTSKPARQYQVEGFNQELLALYERCPTERDRQKLVGSLAALAFAPPLDDWPRMSKRNGVLASKLGPIARAAVARSDSAGITDELLALLRAAVRARDEDREESPSLAEMVSARPALNQALFWADVAAETATSDKPVTKYRDVSPYGPSLWRLEPTDFGWLIAALKRPDFNHRLVAIDTLIVLAFHGDDPQAALERLQALVADDAILTAAVVEARTPREATEEDRKRSEKWAGYDKQREVREEQRRERWRALRARVQADTGLLDDPKRLARWPGPHPLLEVTRWLTKRSQSGSTGAALNWRALEAAFGPDAADAYRRGMKTLWRVTQPERPKENADGTRTIKHTIILSIAGLAIEAAERADWAERLNAEEAARAARHICLDDQTIPEWLGVLLEAHPAIVAPLVAAEMSREWRSSSPYTPFLERAAHSLPIGPLRDGLLKLVLGGPTKNPARVATASDLVLRLELTEVEGAALANLAHRRLRAALKADEDDMSAAQLRLLFRLAPKRGAVELIALLEADMAKGATQRAATLLRNFFNRHRGSVIDPAALGPALLGRLLELSYSLRSAAPMSPSGDDKEGDATSRSDIEDPRNELLSALLRLDGEETYRTMIALSENPVVGDGGHRLRELAREIAERGAERSPWPERLTGAFEADKLAPIGTGADLLELTCALIDEINWSFAKADMSARAVVETAKDERSVQEWLGATLQTTSKGRFQAHREAEVAEDNRPDLVITATSAPVEVAIEVKHDDKGWTLSTLRHALHLQLAEQYLLPANRRHGVLVITNHRDAKFWRDMEAKVRVGFDEVIALLQAEAASITTNSSGTIKVEVRGIDAAPGKRAVSEAKDGRRCHPA